MRIYLLIFLFSASAWSVEYENKVVIMDRGHKEKEEVKADELCQLAVLDEKIEMGSDDVLRTITIQNSSPLQIFRTDGSSGWGAKCKLRISVR